MSEGASLPRLKNLSRNTIFWIVSGGALALYLLAVPLGLYGLCSVPEQSEEIIPGHISISGEQTEQHRTPPHSKPVKSPAVGKTIPTQQTIKQTAEATYYPPREPVGVWWRAAVCNVSLSDWLIGLFTLILAISTIGLWWQTERLAREADAQSGRMVESIREQRRTAFASIVSARAARKAASAAELSSKATLGMELPILRVLSLRTLYDSAGVNEEWLRKFYPAITITNYGRTTAFIEEIRMAIMGANPLPLQPPTIVTENSLTRMLPIAQNASETHTSFHVVENVTDEFVTEFLANADKRISVCGVLKYRDFMGISHEQRFLFLWVDGNKSFFSPVGFDAYNRQI